MASFPTSVKSFASRSNGQTIDAGHVNDLQDEVNAVEDGFLNGTARLNSSNSTVANLSVTGNSTLASSITIGARPYVFPSSGGSTGDVLTIVSTSGSTMTLGWRSGVRAPRAKLSHGANQQSDSTSEISLVWNTQVYGDASMHSTSANSSRLTFAESTGVYHVGVQLTFSTWSAATFQYAEIIMNDSSRVAVAWVNHDNTFNVNTISLNLGADVLVQSTADYVTVNVRSLSGTGTVLAESTDAALGFWAHRVTL